jgi:hypothetical protein
MLPLITVGLVQVWACDPKLMELAFGRPLFDRHGRYAADPAAIADLLETAVADMQARAARFAGNNVTTRPRPSSRSLGTFGSLRWGELAALRRDSIDLEARTVRVDRQLTETISGAPAFGPPKSDAGLRLVPFPDMIAADLRWNLKCFAQEGDDGLVFTSPSGASLRHSNFYRRFWLKAVQKAGLNGSHFRPAPYREHAHRGCRGEPARADGTHGTRQHSGRAYLPALHQRTSAQARRCGRQSSPRGTAQGAERERARGAFWHESDTTPGEGLLTITARSGQHASDLVILAGAPGRIRTRDPLLRRSSAARL